MCKTWHHALHVAVTPKMCGEAIFQLPVIKRNGCMQCESQIDHKSRPPYLHTESVAPGAEAESETGRAWANKARAEGIENKHFSDTSELDLSGGRMTCIEPSVMFCEVANEGVSFLMHSFFRIAII